MDFRSIKRLSLRSLRISAALCVKSGPDEHLKQRTIIKPDFNDWIGSRWRSGTGLFKAALLNFKQPAAPFGQISWPQPRASRSEFLFAPSIQLTFNSYPVTNLFRENHTRNTSHHAISRPVFDVRNLLKSSRTSNTFNFQSSSFSTSALGGVQHWKLSLRPSAYLCVLGAKNLFQRRGRRDTQRAAEIISNLVHHTTLHATERFFEQLAGIRQSHSVTRFSNSTERPTLITISNSLRQLGRIFVNKNNHHESRSHVRQQLTNVRNGINQSIFRNFINAALSFRSWVNIRTVDEATQSRQSFLKQFSNQFLLRQSLRERSFASVVQKFAVSKSSSSSETVARQVQYFGPPPDLTYAKSESPQLQQLVTALRDFRPAQNEIKAPAPQFPTIAQLTSQVRQELERELRIERERRGL